MILQNGVLKTTFPSERHFDGQMHSVEWFHNGEWRRVIDGVYPLQDTEVLDDTLDSGGFCFTNELLPYPDEWMTDENGHVIVDENGNKVENPNSIKFLKQLTPIRILWDSEEDYKAITDDMSDDERAAAEEFNKDLELQLRGKRIVKKPIYRYRIVDEVNIHGEGRLFKFTVKTVEATKLLELVQCDTLTFTNYLIRDEVAPFSSFAVGTKYRVQKSGNIYYDSLTDVKYNIIRDPFKLGSEYDLPYAADVFAMNTKKNNYFSYEIYVKSPSASQRTKVFWSNNSGRGWKDEGNRKVVFSEVGIYTVYYEIHEGQKMGGLTDCYSAVRYTIRVFNDVPKHTSLNIAKVLERILYAGETRRDGIEQQRFVLDDSVKEKFANTHSPEFCITRATFWEALKMVAGHVHCIPRLNWDDVTNSFRIITFDELGQMEECKLKAMHNNRPIAWDMRKSLDSYCGEINTYVDNLVNTRDDIAGCIVEPYEGGWKSARASDGELIVKDDTVVFNMSRPNMRVSKLEIKYGDKEADITKYLFEAAEYKALSDYKGDFPNSKARALKIEQGGKEITEITHMSKEGDDILAIIPDIETVFQTEAIRNIAESEGIGDIPSGHFTEILYRVTYSPISSARIVQKKSYFGDCNGYSRNYNVAGNTIESEYLGEHLKGAIARIGNDIEYRTYMFERSKDVPKPGMLLDGKYIMKVTTQMSTVRFIKATLVLSRDYNQKHEYVALDSSIRYYDVSEKQSIERHINYSEDVIIGDEVAQSENIPMVSSDAVKLYAKVFSDEAVDNQVSWAWFRGCREAVHYNEILLPCLSQAEGNSLIFNFACQDNYGAGWKIDIEKTITEQGFNRYEGVQSQIKYADTYGEFERLELELGNKSGFANLADDARKKLSKSIPEWELEVKPIGLFSTGENPLIISKDSREQLNFTYQLNSVVNRKSIILGSALNSANPLVTITKARTIACYWLPKKINKFSPVIDVSNGAAAQFEIVSDRANRKFHLPSVQNNSSFNAEAIVWVDITDGVYNAKLLIGENAPVAIGEFSQAIWFNFNANE